MKPSNLYSVGYGNRTIEDFISVLKKFNITTLIDVRSIPYSKFRPSFCKATFQKVLSTNGIEYIYKGTELGGMPNDSSFYTNGKVDYDKIRKNPSYQQGLQFVKQQLNSDDNIVIMCSETDYCKCHRWNLIGVDLDKEGYKMKHITKCAEIEICNLLL